MIIVIFQHPFVESTGVDIVNFEASEIAGFGYREALRLMLPGNKLDVVRLWKSEAFDVFRSAVVEGKPSEEWLARFREDFATQGVLDDYEYEVVFAQPSDRGYPSILVPSDEPFVVLRLTRQRDGQALGMNQVVVMPEQDQALLSISSI